MNESLTITIREVAALLGGVSTRSIERWTAAGQFPRPIKLGAKRLWRRADIELFIQAGSIANYKRAKAK
jgi:predicted DNA-binding transcriptional regulator AlpA